MRGNLVAYRSKGKIRVLEFWSGITRELSTCENEYLVLFMILCCSMEG